MSRVSRKTTSLISLLLAFCSIWQLSSAFVIRNTKIEVRTRMEDVTKAISNSKMSATRERVVSDSTSAADEEGDAANVVLQTLEKRLKGGSLTGAELSAAISASDSLLEHLDDVQSIHKNQRTSVSLESFE